MDALLDHAPCGFLRLADDGAVLDVNATLCALTGYDRDVVKGRHVDTLLTPGARIFYQTHVFPLLRMEGRVEEIYLSLRAADKTDIPVLLNAVRRADDGAGISDWVVVPMRRRNQFEDELLQAKKAAEEANRAKARFLSMLSHDVRAPLSSIRMAAEILALGAAGPVTEPQRAELERIQKASRYVLRMVKDLLNYARLHGRRVELRLEAIRTADALERASSMVGHLAAEAGLALRAEPAPAGLRVRADADRLQQVLLNLLTNAVKFTDAGGSVTLACARAADRVLFHVRDTGCGIPADRLEHIFNPFVQDAHGRSGGDDGGVGLGLAISRELTRLMGGRLTVTSQVGEGSTFTVDLPAAG